MQVPGKISFQHDGFVARFGEHRGSPLGFAGVLLTTALGLVAYGMTANVFMFGVIAAVGAVATLLTMRRQQAITLTGSNQNLRIQSTGAAALDLSIEGLLVEVVVKETRSAGRAGKLQSLILTNHEGRWTLPANGWTLDELQALAELLRGLEPGGALPEPPPALRRLLGATKERTRR